MDPWFLPEVGGLLGALGRAGLIGPPFEGRRAAFRAGAQLLQLVSFSGCSPHIRFEPPVDGSGSFCHVTILGPYSRPRLLTGRNTRPPRCSACRSPIADWGARREAWEDSPGAPLTCPQCHLPQLPLQLHWREHAGFGRLFVSVEDVFPGEAVPVPDLLELLESATGTAWRYFFVQD